MGRWARAGGCLVLFGLGVAAGLVPAWREPLPRLEQPPFAQPTRFYARPVIAPAHGPPPPPGLPEGVGIGGVYGRPALDREPVPLHHVPRLCVDAVLQVEDRRFFDHLGLDPRRVAGAAVANLRAGRIVEGGSTITQQLVKNVHLTRERSFARKAREALLALRLERATTKPVILEAYLNEIYLGQRGSVAVHGVGAAARHWFGKPVSRLELAECA